MNQDFDQEKDSTFALHKGRLVEKPFTSNLPLIGSIVARFRGAWNSVATKWYVRPLIEQQSDINRLLLQSLQEFEDQQVLLDRDHTSLTHDQSEIVSQIVQLNQLLQSTNERLARLEEKTSGQQAE